MKKVIFFFLFLIVNVIVRIKMGEYPTDFLSFLNIITLAGMIICAMLMTFALYRSLFRKKDDWE